MPPLKSMLSAGPPLTTSDMTPARMKTAEIRKALLLKPTKL